MAEFQVDLDKCVRCGICSEACPGGIIKNDKDGPKLLFPQACLVCGHCVAVCPEGALDFDLAPISKQVVIEQMPVLDAQEAANFLRSRRSIRCYKKEPVERATLQRLFDMARFAPSGGNSQGLSYIVINNSDVLHNITAATVDWMEEQINKGAKWAARYAGTVKNYRKRGKDVIMRGAPHLLVATAPADFPMGRDNARFALAYVELYAPALGLGTCWAGFVEMCAMAKYQPLLELLQVPADKVVTGALLVGYPKYKYQRLVDRNPLEINWH